MFTNINQSSEKAQFCIHLISRLNTGSEVEYKRINYKQKLCVWDSVPNTAASFEVNVFSSTMQCSKALVTTQKVRAASQHLL